MKTIWLENDDDLLAALDLLAVGDNVVNTVTRTVRIVAHLEPLTLGEAPELTRRRVLKQLDRE